MAILTRKI